MAELIQLDAQIREDEGKKASRRLRRQKLVPAVVYGAGHDSVSITLDHGTLFNLLEEHELSSQILDVDIDGKKEQAVIKDIQYHPYKPKILHIDLMRVKAEEAIDMTVPLSFEGAEKAPGVVEGNGVVSHLLDEVSVRCLPRNLPETISVDLSHMKLNDIVHLSDLELPEGVELLSMLQSEEGDLAVASLHPPQRSSEEEEAASEASEDTSAE